MMRVNFVVEGPTEVSFVREVLYPHLLRFGVTVMARPVFTSNKAGSAHRGGVGYYSRIHLDVSRWCKQDQTAKVTTMFDLYGLPHDFPRREKARREKSKHDEVIALEEAFFESVNCANFMPYLQLHEFEALLFVDIGKLANLYPERAEHIVALKADTACFANPEDINDSPQSAPSKRILKAVPAYNKKLAGVITLLEIGLSKARTKCPHFAQWLSRLENLGKP